MDKDPLIKWISIIYRYSLIYANERLKDFNISAGELSFFIAITDMEGITQEKLSSYLRMNKGTTAKAVKSLETKGYVIKRIPESDKRSYNLYPTAKAVELRKRIRKLAFEWNDILLKGFDKKRRKEAALIIEKMAKNADMCINRSGENDGKKDQ